MSEDSELGERRGTGIKQPTKAQLDAEKKKRGEYVSDKGGDNNGEGGFGDAPAPGPSAE